MDLETFQLEKVAYEIRYAPAYRMWDNSGRFALSLVSAFPTATIIEAQPVKIVMRLDSSHEFAAEFEQSRLIAFKPPRTLETVADTARKSFSYVREDFGISSVLRIGVRFIYFRSFPSKDAAASALLETGRLALPDAISKHLKEQDKILHPEFAFRAEGPVLGSTFRIRAETRHIEFQPSLEMSEHIAPINKDIEGISVDADYYTTTSVKMTQFEPGEWLYAAHKVTRRDCGRLLVRG